MINRREFMALVGGVTALLKPVRESIAADSSSVLVNFPVSVPRQLFFPKIPSREPVLLNALQLISAGNVVLCAFSNGQTIRLDAMSAYLDAVRATQGRRVTRQSILLKSLASWVVDAAWEKLRNQRDVATQAQLRASYEYFQTQSVLQAVTPVSLYYLVRDISRSKQVRSVVWEKDSGRFDVR